MLKDLLFYEVTREADVKARQGRLDQRKKKRQEGTLKQAPGGNRSATTSTVRPSAKKKFTAKATKKAPAPAPVSPSALTSFASASCFHD